MSKKKRRMARREMLEHREVEKKQPKNKKQVEEEASQSEEEGSQSEEEKSQVEEKEEWEVEAEKGKAEKEKKEVERLTALELAKVKRTTVDRLPRAPVGMPLATPGNRSLEVLAESRVTRDGGLIQSIDGQTVKEYLGSLTRKRAEQFRKKYGNSEILRTDVGAVSAVAIDRRTGEVFEGTNGRLRDAITNERLHPLLKARLKLLKGKYQAYENGKPLEGKVQSYPHFENPRVHAEVKAVNELLWKRGGGFGEEVFRELRVDNYFPFNPGGVKSAPCCANCNALLRDVPSNAGRFTGYPPSSRGPGSNFVEE